MNRKWKRRNLAGKVHLFPLLTTAKRRKGGTLMGVGSSKRRNGWPQHHHGHFQYPPPPPPSSSSQLLSSSPHSFSSSSNLSQPTSPSPPTVSTFPAPSAPPPGYAFAVDAPHLAALTCFPLHQPAPYPAALPCPTPPPHAYHYYPQYSVAGYADPVMMFSGRINYPYYAPNQGGAWWAPPAPTPYAASSSSSSTVVQHPPPPYVEHQQIITIKNNVNLHKDTIRLEQDLHNPDQYLVCFTFDSLVDGNISILYFAKEGKQFSFVPLCPEICMPVRIPFQKGIGQKFCQPSGSGIDVRFFELYDLSKPSQEDTFPLIIYAEACPQLSPTVEGFSHLPAALCAQITQAVIEKKSKGHFQVKATKQILWVGGERYELKEIFGLANSGKSEFGDDDSGKECVICLSELKDTAVLPCRHMCMCAECAKALRLQSNKCPICRQPVEELVEIKVPHCSPVEAEIIGWPSNQRMCQ